MLKKQITKKKELALIKKYQKTKNSLILEELIKAHRGWIETFCIKTYKTFKGVVEYQDLRQAAMLGFIKGIQNFDIFSGNRLLTYNTFWMKNHTYDLLCRSTTVHIPAHVLRLIIWPKEDSKALIEMFDRVMNPLQIQRQVSTTTSNDVVLPRDVFEDFNKTDYTTILFEKHFLPKDVEEAITNLSPEMYDVFYLKSGMNGKYTIAEISEILNLTMKQVELLYKRAIYSLRKNPAILKLAA